MKKNGFYINCEHCKKPNYYSKQKSERSLHHYCNTTCQNKAEKLKGIDKTLKAHKSIKEKGHYKRDNSYLVNDNPATSLEARKKISEAKLKNNWMRGRFKHFNHGYKGGKTLYRGWNWKTTRIAVKNRDGYTCVKCGMTEVESSNLFDQPLQVDHITPWRISKDNSMENLQTLCCRCHGRDKQKEEYNMF